MKLKKKFLVISNISFLLLLNNCVQSSTAFLGPIITAGKTGNIYHAGLSYTSSNLIEKQLGKNPTIYVKVGCFLASFFYLLCISLPYL